MSSNKYIIEHTYLYYCVRLGFLEMVAVGLESEVAENLSILKNQAKRRTEWTLEKNEIQDTLIPLFQGLIDFLCYNVKLGLFALQGSLYLKTG